MQIEATVVVHALHLSQIMWWPDKTSLQSSSVRLVSHQSSSSATSLTYMECCCICRYSVVSSLELLLKILKLLGRLPFWLSSVQWFLRKSRWWVGRPVCHIAMLVLHHNTHTRFSIWTECDKISKLLRNLSINEMMSVKCKNVSVCFGTLSDHFQVSMQTVKKVQGPTLAPKQCIL